MECPFCQSSLFPFEEHRIHLDKCESGHRIWFDRGESEAYRRNHQEFQTSSSQGAQQFQPLSGETVRNCPRCETQTLVAGSLSDLEIHQCSTCRGVFLGQSKSGVQETSTSGEVEAGIEIGSTILEALASGIF